MNIEETIQKLTAALEANTAKLEEILAVASANVADKAVAAPPKEAKPKKQKDVNDLLKNVPDASSPPEEKSIVADFVPTPEPETPVTLNMLKEAVKAAIFNENDPTAREKFNDLREKFGIDKVAELNEDQIQEFYREVKNW